MGKDLQGMMTENSAFSLSFQNKVNGTIWEDIDDLKVFKTLDLEEFQGTFSAYQRPTVPYQQSKTIKYTFFILFSRQLQADG